MTRIMIKHNQRVPEMACDICLVHIWIDGKMNDGHILMTNHGVLLLFLCYHPHPLTRSLKSYSLAKKTPLLPQEVTILTCPVRNAYFHFQLQNVLLRFALMNITQGSPKRRAHTHVFRYDLEYM
jgi:hypothetical protein